MTPEEPRELCRSMFIERRRENRNRNKSGAGHKERGAKLAREVGKRSQHQRCPNCKKLRRKWFRANAYDPGRRAWGRLTTGGSKVCWLCIERAQSKSERK